MKMFKNIDSNMVVETNLNLEDVVWTDVLDGPVDIYGFNHTLLKKRRFGRLPTDTAKLVSARIMEQKDFTAGGRIRFSTNTKYIAIKAKISGTYLPSICPLSATIGFDIYEFLDGKEKFFGAYRPPADAQDGYESVIYTKTETMRSYTINFPYLANVEKLYIGVNAGAEIDHGVKYANDKPFIFYGSSITHGAAASRPGNTYESFISQKYNLDYYNFGFAGNAKGEEAMAVFLASHDMSIFVCDYDHNAPSEEHLQDTHYTFYEIIRERHPHVPYIMISKPDFFTSPASNSRRRQIIIDSFEKAKANGDENVYFIDGETLFDGEFYESCTVDGCHPNDMGFYRMATVIGRTIEKL